jgi:alpha-beta hydrolase superfamily lysophospholipase
MSILMNSNERFFKTIRGPELFYRAWHPEAAIETKAVIIIIHGGGEHSGRYLNPVNYLVPRGYPVYAYDLPGHGKSPGKRGHVNRFTEFLDATDSFLQFVRKDEGGKPVFLLGHSIGGLIAVDYALKHPELPGLILSSPFLRMKLQVPAWKSVIAKTASYFMPALTLHNGLIADDLCHEREVCMMYRRDPLVHDLASVRFYTEMLAAQSRTMRDAGRLKTPMLLLYGSADRIADPEGAKAFNKNAGCSDKKIVVYEGFYHEIFNEKNNILVFRNLVEWMESQLKPKS